MLIGARFEDLKRLDTNNIEYWSARELQLKLGYKSWRSFMRTIRKAMLSCNQAANDVTKHFISTTKNIGAKDKHIVDDYKLSRFACYLIAQNGDITNPEIAKAQEYFIIQTRRQELSAIMQKDLERLYVKRQVTKLFKALSGAARAAGVSDDMFAAFHDAGYRGLYGGLNSDTVKDIKGVPQNEHLIDRMGATELAANQFRMTQTRDKLTRDHIKDPVRAIFIHHFIGQEIRRMIEVIGGVLPEDLAPTEHVKKVEKRISNTLRKLSKPRLSIDNINKSLILRD